MASAGSPQVQHMRKADGSQQQRKGRGQSSTKKMSPLFPFPLQIRTKQSLVSVTVFQITAVSIPLPFIFTES
jgi:hypothetical protein